MVVTSWLSISAVPCTFITVLAVCEFNFMVILDFTYLVLFYRVSIIMNIG